MRRTFDRDYLLYSVKGAVRLHAGGRTWLLPPAFAAWVPADTPIDFDLPHAVTTCSILFERGFCSNVQPRPPERPVVFTMTPLAREMTLHTRRWGANSVLEDGAEAFFLVLASVVAELARTPSDVWRPTTDDPHLTRALAYIEGRLSDEPTLAETAAAAGLSKRTLERRYATELGMTWAQSLRRVRMIAATERLVTTNDPVTTVAYDVGYHSLSAFNAAFREFAGQTPSAMRRG